MALNKVLIIGNLGRDPEVGKTSGGVSVAKLSVATSERYKDRNGDIKETTEWHIVRVWRNNAEFIGRYGKKGSEVYVEGKLHEEKWEDREGQKRSQVIVEASDIQILGRKNEERGGDANRQQYEPKQGDFDPRADDLPF